MWKGIFHTFQSIFLNMVYFSSGATLLGFFFSVAHGIDVWFLIKALLVLNPGTSFGYNILESKTSQTRLHTLIETNLPTNQSARSDSVILYWCILCTFVLYLKLFHFQNFKRYYGASKEFVNSYELWRGHFKEIEGERTWPP